MSKMCELSKIYTNHSIRVTGASLLTRMKYSLKEIMSVTGYKSDDKKKEMAKVMNQSLTKSDVELQKSIQAPNATSTKNVDQVQDAIALMPPPPPPTSNQPKVAEIAPNPEPVIPFEANLDEDVPNFNLMSILSEFNKEEMNENVPNMAQAMVPVNNTPQHSTSVVINKNQNQPGTPNMKNTTISSLIQQRNSPMFAGCKIGQVNITIQKKD